MEKIQMWGNMELISLENVNSTISKEEPFSDDVLKLKFMVDFLSKFTRKQSLWNKLKNGLPEVRKEKVKKIDDITDIQSDYRALRCIEKDIKETQACIAEVSRKIEQYKAISSLAFSEIDLKLKKVNILIGKLDRAGIEQLQKNNKIYYKILLDSEHPIAAVLYLKSDYIEVDRVLSEINIHKIEFPENKMPEEKVKELISSHEKLQEKKRGLEKGLKSNYIKKKLNYEILLDFYDNRKELKSQAEKTKKTRYFSVISGWIPASRKDEIIALLGKYYSKCYIEFSCPEKTETPPVILKNNVFSNSFEVVTNLYGVPDYNWIDPTPYLAPFFAFFFGLCLTDAGYGIILAVICLWSIKKLKLSSGVKKFMMLMFWGSLASVLAGVLTGGWFGNAFSSIKAIDNLKIINPLEKPQYFLYFSVVLGYIQVMFGVVLSIIQNFKTGNKKTAFFEELPWVFILLAIPGFFIGGIGSKIGSIFVIGGIAGVVGLSGYKNKNIFVRIGSGLYSLYGGTDYFKDMISYSRLFALGMGTAILGMAVNEMSLQALSIPVVGYLLMVLIFVGGHVFNIAMSVLSAYIHTSRLQYVEYFTKFFKGGGKSFMPFSWKNKRMNFIATIN